MGADVPKQFLRLGGEPILAVTLRKFMPYAEDIVVVLPEAHIPLWESLAEECHLQGTHKVCEGGATRFHSVQNGLGALDPECYIVAVHDGVRPLLAPRSDTHRHRLGAPEGQKRCDVQSFGKS